MRSILLILLLANAMLFAWQFPAVQAFVTRTPDAPRASQVNAERLRIIRETGSRPPEAPRGAAPAS